MLRMSAVAGAVLVLVGTILAAVAGVSRPEGPTPAAGAGFPADAPFVGAEPVLLSDPPGDATDIGAGGIPTMVGCWVGGALTGDCVDLPTAGTPAPHYDLLEAGLAAETRDAIDLSITVAQLTEGFPQLEGPEGIHRMASWSMCWVPGDDAASRCASLYAMLHDGEAHVQGYFEIRGNDCNEWSWCGWTVPAVVTYGAPATIRITVPKALATFDGAPPTIGRLWASSGWMGTPEGFPMWHLGLTLHTPAYHAHDHAGAAAIQISDYLPDAVVGIELQPSEAPVAAPPPSALMPLGPGTHAPGSRYDEPEMDLLAFDLYEDGDEIVAAFTVREFTDVPPFDFDYSVAVGLGWNVWEIGYRREGGRDYGYAGRCIMEPCQNGTGTEVPVQLVPGSPAQILVRTPLEFIGKPASGTPTNLFWVMAMYVEPAVYHGSWGDAVWGEAHSVFVVDEGVGGAPFVFGSGHRAPPLAAMPTTHGH